MQPKQKFTDQQVIDLYNKKLNDRQIAEILNVSGSFIARKRWKLGLQAINPKHKSNTKLSYEKLKEKNKRSSKKTNQRPERKATKKAEGQTAERKAYMKNYGKTYRNRPEVKAKIKERYHKKHPNAKYRKTTNQTKT